MNTAVNTVAVNGTDSKEVSKVMVAQSGNVTVNVKKMEESTMKETMSIYTTIRYTEYVRKNAKANVLYKQNTKEFKNASAVIKTLNKFYTAQPVADEKGCYNLKTAKQLFIITTVAEVKRLGNSVSKIIWARQESRKNERVMFMKHSLMVYLADANITFKCNTDAQVERFYTYINNYDALKVEQEVAERMEAERTMWLEELANVDEDLALRYTLDQYEAEVAMRDYLATVDMDTYSAGYLDYTDHLSISIRDNTQFANKVEVYHQKSSDQVFVSKYMKNHENYTFDASLDLLKNYCHAKTCVALGIELEDSNGASGKVTRDSVMSGSIDYTELAELIKELPADEVQDIVSGLQDGSYSIESIASMLQFHEAVDEYDVRPSVYTAR